MLHNWYCCCRTWLVACSCRTWLVACIRDHKPAHWAAAAKSPMVSERCRTQTLSTTDIRMHVRPLSRKEVREVDRRAIEEFGLPGIVLMENAGRGTAELLVDTGVGGQIVVCAGKGNNGGDGFVIARHLENRGYRVRVLLMADPAEIRGDAAVNLNVLRAADTPVEIVRSDHGRQWLDQQLTAADWIVDALLGTGTRGTIQKPWSGVIEAINAASGHILAVDLPSGLDCDTGKPLGHCVRADHTATFVVEKTGFADPEAGEFTGEVHVVEIGIPVALLASL